jgi:hypothetical protein
MVIGEQALRTDVGGGAIMRGQLERLLATVSWPNVRIGIVPLDAGYRVPLHNGFWILDSKLVQFDTYTAELSLTRPDEVAQYARAFERLAALAVYGPEAGQLIESTLSARKN